jgi:hypothetical protein
MQCVGSGGDILDEVAATRFGDGFSALLAAVPSGCPDVFVFGIGWERNGERAGSSR